MITITEKTIGIWFLQCTKTQDWNAALEWDSEEAMKAEVGDMKFTYRFRYYAPIDRHSDDPNNVFSGKDKKNWYSGVFTGKSKEAVIIQIREMANQLITKLHAVGELYEILNEGDVDNFMKKFMQQPWAHGRVQDSYNDGINRRIRELEN
jgi:hypothetical protein